MTTGCKLYNGFGSSPEYIYLFNLEMKISSWKENKEALWVQC